MTVNTTVRISDTQFDEAVTKLGEFTAIPSVSNTGSPDYSMEHLDAAARFAMKELTDLGFDVRSKRVNDSPLFIMAERIYDAAMPTVLLYGHYDVQPVDREKWDTDPFTMVQKDGRLYGRGASDDKAGVMVITSALKTLKEAGVDPKMNVKILFEGEEEFGSSNMGDLLKQEAAALTADALIVMDGGNQEVDTGTIENSTRGVLTMALRIDALKQPTHSGVGCLAPDPAIALCSLAGSFADPRKIEGFMDDVVEPSDEEITMLKESSQTEESYRKEHGVINGNLRGDATQSIYHRVLAEPSISVINMKAGEPNGGNSIQSSAEATIGVRLTAGQDPARIEACVRRHLENQAVPFGLSFTFERAGLSAKAWKTDATKPFATKFLNAMSESYPKTAVMPTGGTIPLFSDFEEAFPNMEMFIAGVEDPKTAAHSHNESQDISIYRNAINSVIAFLRS